MTQIAQKGAFAASAPWNGSRFEPGTTAGFYESFFVRANHPTRPLAFWIRYTVFCPKDRPADARGELWAIYFDAEQHRVAAVKDTVPIADCSFSGTRLDVRIGRSALTDGVLEGGSALRAHAIEWRLNYTGGQQPLLLLPAGWYERALPKAKVLVGTPNASFTGTVTVDGEPVSVDGWIGSQNHNWGTQHTDRYAWAQVAGFDNAPDAFLECSTAQVRLGPLWSPRLTLAVLRLDGEEFALNGWWRAFIASGTYRPFEWTFTSRGRGVRISGRLHAPASAFVGLTYDNPPGGTKTCLNTKIATAEITVARAGRETVTLVSSNRAAFEILTEEGEYGVPVLV